MSHYSSLKTKVKRRSALIKALQQIDNGRWKNCVEIHNEPMNLYGYSGDIRPQKAEVIIRRKDVGQAANDIGFAQQKDGTYEAIISEFDSNRHNSTWLDKLNQVYSKEVIREVADLNGFSFECIQQGDELHITCGRN